jgi:hypothetical protein
MTENGRHNDTSRDENVKRGRVTTRPPSLDDTSKTFWRRTLGQLKQQGPWQDSDVPTLERYVRACGLARGLGKQTPTTARREARRASLSSTRCSRPPARPSATRSAMPRRFSQCLLTLDEGVAGLLQGGGHQTTPLRACEGCEGWAKAPLFRPCRSRLAPPSLPRRSPTRGCIAGGYRRPRLES